MAFCWSPRGSRGDARIVGGGPICFPQFLAPAAPVQSNQLRKLLNELNK